MKHACFSKNITCSYLWENKHGQSRVFTRQCRAVIASFINSFVQIKSLYIILTIAFFTSTISVLSQETGLFSKEEWEKANTAVDVTYLTTQEKEVIRYMNLSRMNGKKYYDSFIQAYIDRHNAVYSTIIKSNNKYLKSLKSDLYKTKDLDILIPDKKISDAAARHAEDMGKSGKTGHSSSKGVDFEERMLKALGTKYYLSENCSYGSGEGIDIVCQLLLDDGVVSLGHRLNTLNPKQKYVGVSIKPHKIYEYNCVIDFYSNTDFDNK